MTIEKGRDWGERKPLPASGVLVRSDAEAREVVTAARRSGAVIPTLGLLGGDLCRTLGGTGDRSRMCSPDAMTFHVDLGVAVVEGEERCFVAHLIARRRWWRGRLVAVMNAQWLGGWDLGPRAHPGDGLLDLTDGDMAFAQRLQARKRLATGTHLPHPDLVTRRERGFDLEFDPALDVWLDGELVASTARLSVHAEPDAIVVVV